MEKIKAPVAFFIIFIAIALNFSAISAPSMQFSDVQAEDWYYADVKTVSDRGIVNGYPDGKFRPQGNVTRAEFIKMLIVGMDYEKLGGLYFPDTLTDVQKQPYWFHEYISTALNENIIYRDEYDGSFLPDSQITRREVAVFVKRALDLTLMPYATPYQDSDDLYLSALYNECIMQGNLNPGGSRSFYPDGFLTRAECCAVISRLLEYLEDQAAFKKRFYNLNQTSPLPITLSPETEEAIYYSMLRALQNGANRLRFTYDGVPYSSNLIEVIQCNVISAFHMLSASRPEYVSFMGIEFTKAGNALRTSIDIVFTSAQEKEITFAALIENGDKAREKAMEILPSIVEGLDRDGDKAGAIHDYLVLNARYDESQSPVAASFTAYGALIEGKAVCQGYTAAFNLLCSLAGIKSQCVRNNTHAWNVAMISGSSLYYDATWDDPLPDIPERMLYEYRGIREEVLLETHHWDKSDFKIRYFD